METLALIILLVQQFVLVAATLRFLSTATECLLFCIWKIGVKP